MADMEPRVCRVLDAIEAHDWEAFAALLDPEVHWTNQVEEDLHGRTAVVEAFRHDPPPAPPSWHETRYGLIVRWIDCPG